MHVTSVLLYWLKYIPCLFRSGVLHFFDYKSLLFSFGYFFFAYGIRLLGGLMILFARSWSFKTFFSLLLRKNRLAHCRSKLNLLCRKLLLKLKTLYSTLSR